MPIWLVLLIAYLEGWTWGAVWAYKERFAHPIILGFFWWLILAHWIIGD